MHRVWVHQELALRYGAPSCDEEPVRGRPLNVPLILGVSACIVLLTALPLLITHSRRVAAPAIVRAALPRLELGDLGIYHRSKFRMASLKVASIPARQTARTPSAAKAVIRLQPSAAEAAQAAYITGQIQKTGIQGLAAAQLANLIVAESARAKVDPFLAAAIIFAESTFRNHARSHAGAVGLMQIQPDTGRYVSRLYRVRWPGPAALHDPRYNIRLGLAYLEYLKGLFDGDLSHALVAYNWGPTNLSQHLRSRGRRPPLESLQYSRKIQHLSTTWRQQFKTQTAMRGVGWKKT